MDFDPDPLRFQWMVDDTEITMEFELVSEERMTPHSECTRYKITASKAGQVSELTGEVTVKTNFGCLADHRSRIASGLDLPMLMEDWSRRWYD